MERGRPTLYSSEMLEKAEKYIENHEDYGDPVPTAAGLADELGTSKRALYRWAEKHEDFRHTLDRLNGRQERKLSAGGLGGELQPTIVKLMMANHGYSEKQELEHSTGEKGFKIEVEFVGKDSDSETV